ncbi:MAG: DNA-3-methyladenine glycosylase [Clostridiales bacterium]
MTRLERSFYLKDTVEVARNLLGMILVRQTGEGLTAGRIVETEAYAGAADAACHAARGRRGGRTAVMYGPGGFAYVYLIYGMYYCMNVVTRAEEEPEAVLIRALEPLTGLELMAKRRNIRDVGSKKGLHSLCTGPGKLCQAMAIDKDCYGLDLCGSELYIEQGQRPAARDIAATKRINIDYAGEAKDYPWRFLLRDNPYVSVKVKEDI